jgi:hypothetical protein
LQCCVPFVVATSSLVIAPVVIPYITLELNTQIIKTIVHTSNDNAIPEQFHVTCTPHSSMWAP